MSIFIPNMKFLSLIMYLGGLCTDADADTDNHARWTNHDYLGLLGIIPTELKTVEELSVHCALGVVEDF